MENSKVSFVFLRSLRKAPASLKAALYGTAAFLLGAVLLSFPSFHYPGSYSLFDYLTLSICAVCLYGAVPADCLTSSGLTVIFILMLFSGMISVWLSAKCFSTLLSDKEESVVRPLRLYVHLSACLVCGALLFFPAFYSAYGLVSGALKSAFMAVSVLFGCGLNLLSQRHTEVFGHVLIYNLAVFVSSVLGGSGIFLKADSSVAYKKQGAETKRWLFYYLGIILLFFFVFSLLGLMSAEPLPGYELLSSAMAQSATSGGGNVLVPGFLEKAGYIDYLMSVRMVLGKGMLSFYSVSLYVLFFSLLGHAFGEKRENTLKLCIKKAAFTFAVFLLSAAVVCLAFVFLAGKGFAYSLSAALSICSLCPSPLYTVFSGNGPEQLLVLAAVFFSRFIPPLIWELTRTRSRDDIKLPAEETAEQTAPKIEEVAEANG